MDCISWLVVLHHNRRGAGVLMKKINSLEELNIPHNYKAFILHFLSNITSISNVERVILFGSCAREDVNEHKSDIDLLVITENDVTLNEEFHIMSDCAPAYDNEYYIPSDIIVTSVGRYNQNKDKFGMVQKQVEREGVDISGLLR